MTTITQEIRINAPKDRVWAILADLGAVQRFHPGVKKSYYSTTQKEGVGASRVCELLPLFHNNIHDYLYMNEAGKKVFKEHLRFKKLASEVKVGQGSLITD